MIVKLQNADLAIAAKIRSVFQVSYAVEAEILKAVDFPPLKRNLESFLSSSNTFYGYLKNEELAAVADLWVCDKFHTQPEEVGITFSWTDNINK